MKRQGLIVTARELKDLANKLENHKFSNEDTTWQINIINQEGLSDTWKIEDAI